MLLDTVWPSDAGTFSTGRRKLGGCRGAHGMVSWFHHAVAALESGMPPAPAAPSAALGARAPARAGAEQTLSLIHI